MSYHSAFEIGRSALFASQAAIQIAGHNMANATTPGFHRRSIHLLPAQGGVIGTRMYMGNGVSIGSINREIDLALQARYRASISREATLAIDQQFLVALETLQNELGEGSLSSSLDSFFGSFSELSNTGTDSALRTIALQQGEVLTARISELAAGYDGLASEVSAGIENTVDAANGLLEQIASLNEQIGTYEGSGNEASELRDQRDLLVNQLSQFIDVTATEVSGGMIELRVGSTPILVGAESRGLDAVRQTDGNGNVTMSIRVGQNGSGLEVNGGSLHGLLTQQTETIGPAREALDTLAFALINEVNRLHSQGQGERGWMQLTGTVGLDDPTAVLGGDASGIVFPIDNGQFTISLRDPDSGEIVQAFDIQVDPQTMSLQDVVDQINAVSGGGISASIDGNGRLELLGTGGNELTFSDDSSGFLSAVGVNTFFTGSSAADIGISEALLASPELLALGNGNVDGSTATALAIAGLQDSESSLLQGQAITDFWAGSVGTLGIRTSAGAGMFQSSSMVRENLAVQMMSVSGVSMDEETINLLAYERQFEAAARYLSVVDETLEILMNLV
ncbi:MAG: flagellar hook-associated protein FlgK [Phycisphaerae bacterium]|nr:flagellar hook-associated protein FlgK [Phycisphaerae bacterium]|tara:strand:+ start:149 stop:1846 length:1698 start_codon:yes stop_codon:yes gene_type:complete